ncbi:hypothetical protein TWF696_001568 [Orbilia brochopaga]|uniref:RBR-type E3 ubiquitin transferase n=1 Tax=Orbilia brochopaga TaxID=3140254 RepID=A0AAV9U921_9PEZI
MSTESSKTATYSYLNGTLPTNPLLLLFPIQHVNDSDDCNPIRLFVCHICCEEIPRYQEVRLRCGHLHCLSCLQQNFDRAAKIERPAQCCNVIDVSFALSALDETTLRKYLTAEQRFKSKTFIPCYRCQAILLDGSIHDGGAFCLDCKDVTCLQCHQKMHGGPCRELELVAGLANLAENENWAVCYRCKYIVAKNGGCNHIICRCGAQFCYLCGGEWGQCICGQTGIFASGRQSVRQTQMEESRKSYEWAGWNAERIARHEQQALLARREFENHVRKLTTSQANLHKILHLVRYAEVLDEHRNAALEENERLQSIMSDERKEAEGNGELLKQLQTALTTERATAAKVKAAYEHVKFEKIRLDVWRKDRMKASRDMYMRLEQEISLDAVQLVSAAVLSFASGMLLSRRDLPWGGRLLTPLVCLVTVGGFLAQVADRRNEMRRRCIGDLTEL